jgi:hypothetical protein
VYSAPAVVPYALFPYAQGGNTYWVHCGLSAVYVDNGTTRTNITGTAPTGAIDNRWTGGVLSGVLVLNNGVDQPQYWGGTGTLAVLAGWNSTWRAGFLRPWRTFLLAGDITKGSTRYPHMLKLSDSAVPGSIPASWDATNPALDAVERDAAQTEDYLVDAMPLGDMMIVYKTRSMYFIRETFDARVIELQRLPGDYGMLARGCGAVTPVGHVVLTSGDVVLHAGQGADSIADDVVRQRIFAGIESANSGRCFVTANPAQSEVWVCFPESGQTTCTLAAVWSWVSKRWTFRTLPNLTHGAYGAIIATPASDIVDSGTGLVDADGSLVDAIDAPPNESRLVVCNASAIGVADSGPTDFGASITWYVERYGLPGSSPDQSGAIDPGQVVTLTDVLPRFNAPNGTAITVTVGAAMTPSGNYTLESPVTFTVGNDFEANVFASGRYLYLKLAGTTSDVALRSLQFNGSIDGRY